MGFLSGLLAPPCAHIWVYATFVEGGSRSRGGAASTAVSSGETSTASLGRAEQSAAGAGESGGGGDGC